MASMMKVVVLVMFIVISPMVEAQISLIGIDNEATANNDQKDTCRCLGKFGSSLQGLFIEENGAVLFAKCGAKTHYKISLSSDDCNRFLISAELYCIGVDC
ncbi:hypothetical protein P8452_35861 [Trifolium repens]|nr:hypothetical protein P8452_35861 [Trifolium repens]